MKTKPPATINGKRNPEYQKWYRATEAGKLQVKKWNDAKGRDAVKKHRSSIPYIFNQVKASVEREVEVKCLDCGMTFDALSAAENGFRFRPRSQTVGLCLECQ